MKNPIIGRLGRAAKEFLLLVFNACSITINVVFYGGSRYQTLSSRAYIDSKTSLRWDTRRKRINKVFFWQENHCRSAWESEVTRAKRTLQRHGELDDIQTKSTE